MQTLSALVAVGLLSLSTTLSAAEEASAHHDAPSAAWTLPFVFLLLAIAVFPLIGKIAHWWEHNSSKLIVAVGLSLVTCGYYLLRSSGFHDVEAGMPTLLSVLHHAVISDYIPFMVLLFSLYTISGGIRLESSLRPTPLTNSAFLLIGTLLASFIGTTGASMLLIRPLLDINKSRQNVKHTVIFFIFLVSNAGGLLLPVGDPPLFLGYLSGVPFLWTLHLVPIWLVCMAILLPVYFALDVFYQRKESAGQGEQVVSPEPMRIEISGKINFVLLVLVVFAVALLVPGKTLPGTEIVIPNLMLRELAQLGLAAASWMLTSKQIRAANHFNFGAIQEVAFLFIGIFLTMQPAIEILQTMGPQLGLEKPIQYFWASGMLSSFLDNAPTYVVFFQTAGSLPAVEGMEMMTGVKTATGSISIPLLTAVSCGSVLMGANTYIGNGPNFMVKSIAEMKGVRMPSFFGYMLYSLIFLIPTFGVVTLIFFMK